MWEIEPCHDFPYNKCFPVTFSNCTFMSRCNYIVINGNISKGSISTRLQTRSSRCFPLTSSTAASLCDEFVPSWSQPVNGLYDGYLWPWPQRVDESDPCVHLCFRDVKPNSGWDWSMSGRCGDKARGEKIRADTERSMIRLNHQPLLQTGRYNVPHNPTFPDF